MSNQRLSININYDFVSLGTCLAVVISYAKYKSIAWAAFHGLLSWLYVAYYVIKFGIN